MRPKTHISVITNQHKQLGEKEFYQQFLIEIIYSHLDSKPLRFNNKQLFISQEFLTK